MGATAEGCIFNVPSMGVSLLDHAADADFSECCRLGRMLARRVLKEGFTARNLLKPQRAEATASERVESLSPSGWSLGT